MQPKVILQLKNLNIGYKKALVSNIDAELKTGEIVLLMGNNGEGKTTLFKTLLKQISPLAGNIEVLGESLEKIPIKQLAKYISVVFSKAYIPQNFTTYDLISLGKYIHYPYYFSLDSKDKKSIEEIISTLNLEPFKNTPLHQLSDGNLQKAFIGRALAQDTPILILDEPTTHLDLNNRKMILNLLQNIARRQQKAILFSSHDIFGASEVADNIWHIQNNKMSCGLAEDLLLQYISKNEKPSSLPFSSADISAPELEKKLFLNAISKAKFIQFPPVKISYSESEWKVITSSEQMSFSNIEETIKALKSLKY